ncbi:hypothetical protein FKM82_027050 [Ascaphus truei]
MWFITGRWKICPFAICRPLDLHGHLHSTRWGALHWLLHWPSLGGAWEYSAARLSFLGTCHWMAEPRTCCRVTCCSEGVEGRPCCCLLTTPVRCMLAMRRHLALLPPVLKWLQPALQLLLPQPVLQLLLPQLVLDVEAEGHRALVLLAVLGVVAAQSNKLLADGTPSVGLALAALGVLHHPLHLLAGR